MRSHVPNSHKTINTYYRKAKQVVFSITLSPIPFCNDNRRGKKKKLRPIHVSVPKSWKPQLRWLECQAFPPLQYVTVSTSQRSKAHLSFQYILFFYLFIKSRMCFLCPSKISCQCQTCLTFKILIHSFIEAEILAYVSDKSFKFQHLKLCRLVCHYDNNFYMSLEQS